MNIKTLILLALIGLAACKEKTPARTRLDIPLNQKIDALLKEANAATDDNKKAALFGEAAELLVDKGDLKAALNAARSGERANPTQKQCLTAIAEVQLAEGKVTEAAQTIRDALQRHPNHGRAHYVQGNVYASQANYAAALKSYAAAEKNKFEDHRLVINTGAINLRAKKSRDALRAYERAIKLYPDLAEAYLGAGIAAQSEKKKADAKTYFEKYLVLAPNSSEAGRVKVWLKGL
jgi:tetratricopeptide (TPR) repeat protein